jgi:hypothetical protein
MSLLKKLHLPGRVLNRRLLYHNPSHDNEIACFDATATKYSGCAGDVSVHLRPTLSVIATVAFVIDSKNEEDTIKALSGCKSQLAGAKILATRSEKNKIEGIFPLLPVAPVAVALVFIHRLYALLSCTRAA